MVLITLLVSSKKTRARVKSDSYRARLYKMRRVT